MSREAINISIQHVHTLNNHHPLDSKPVASFKQRSLSQHLVNSQHLHAYATLPAVANSGHMRGRNREKESAGPEQCCWDMGV